jgi:hypothetical protein
MASTDNVAGVEALDGETLSQLPDELAEALNLTGPLAFRAVTVRLWAGRIGAPDCPRNVKADASVASGAPPEPPPTPNKTVTTAPTDPTATVTWPAYDPAASRDASAETMRVAGVVPLAGDTDNHPVVEPRYRTEAVN